jgi:hypothetical protein
MLVECLDSIFADLDLENKEHDPITAFRVNQEDNVANGQVQLVTATSLQFTCREHRMTQNMKLSNILKVNVSCSIKMCKQKQVQTHVTAKVMRL